MDIIYKKATIEDAYGICYVSAHSWKETYTGLLPDEYLNERVENISSRVDKTKRFLENYKGEYIVAKDGNKVVGILAYYPSSDEKYKDYGHIEAIYVLKEYQNRGIGKELFKRAVEVLKEQGFTKMQLECMVGNDTINFYKKYNGFVESQIDYPINRVGLVKADIVLFDDLDEVLSLLQEKNDYKKIREI